MKRSNALEAYIYEVLYSWDIQIRSLRDPYPLIQTVVLRNVRRLTGSNKAIIVGLDNSVHGLFPVPLGAQVQWDTEREFA